ncbi:phospholipase D family protein [Vibrio sp. RC27]
MEKTTALVNSGNSVLDKMVEKDLLANSGKSGAIILNDGLDAFVARASLAIAAEKTLDIQYYLYHEDTIGGLLTNQILVAADRGVRVRLLLDDMGQEGKDKNLLILDSHPNIDIRIFNPFARGVSRIEQFTTRLGDVTRRMHNKMFIADSSMVILGGRNIGDEYFDINPNNAFSDLDVLLTGTVVSQSAQVFDLYWNSEVVYPIKLLSKEEINNEDLEKGRQALLALTDEQANSPYVEALKASRFTLDIKNHDLPFSWVDADIISDHPLKVRSDRSLRELHMTKKLEPYFESITNELLLITPYFVPAEEGVTFFNKLIEKGIKITVITNSLASNDVAAVHSGYSRYRKKLLKMGVSLYEIKPKINVNTTRVKRNKSTFGASKTSLHAKSFVLDRKHIFIGSLNLDPRSAYENTEVGTVITSSIIGQKMVHSIAEDIDQLAFKLSLQDGDIVWSELKDGQVIEYETEPYTSWWQRVSVKLLQLLPIESQL